MSEAVGPLVQLRVPDMSHERVLQRRDAHAILRFDFSSFNVADGRQQMGMVGNGFDLSQIARRTVEGGENTRADRGESEGW